MTSLGVIIVSWLFVTRGWVRDGLRLNGRADGRRGGRTDRWTDGRRGGRTDGWTDGRMDGGWWMDGWIDRWIDIVYMCVYPFK